MKAVASCVYSAQHLKAVGGICGVKEGQGGVGAKKVGPLDTQDAALGSTCNIQMKPDLRSTTLDLFLADTAGDEVELWSSGVACAKIVKTEEW